MVAVGVAALLVASCGAGGGSGSSRSSSSVSASYHHGKWKGLASGCPVLNGAVARQFGVSGEGRRGPEYHVLKLRTGEQWGLDCLWGGNDSDTAVVRVRGAINLYQEPLDDYWDTYRRDPVVPGVGDAAVWVGGLRCASDHLAVRVDNVVLRVSVCPPDLSHLAWNDDEWFLPRTQARLKELAIGIVPDVVDDLQPRSGS